MILPERVLGNAGAHWIRSGEAIGPMSFLTQLRIYHKYRVHRVLHAGGDLDGRPAPMEADYFKAVRAGEVYGGNAVSFLMSF